MVEAGETTQMYRPKMMICVRDKEITGAAGSIMSHRMMISENSNVTMVDPVPQDEVALHVVVLPGAVAQVAALLEEATQPVAAILSKINAIPMSEIFTVRILETINKIRAMIKVGGISTNLNNRKLQNRLPYFSESSNLVKFANRHYQLKSSIDKWWMRHHVIRKK